MRVRPPRFSVIALGLAALPAMGVESTLTSPGYTGLGITPNAHLLGWGRAELAYENQLPGIVSDPRAGPVRTPNGHNYVLGFGLLPNLEIAGRLATNTLDVNCFTANCGARDLSASAKVAIGLDAAGKFRIAAGATDIGGAVTYFRSYYGVITFDEGPFQASAGLARRVGPGIAGSRAPLGGIFAAAAWQPLPLVRAQIEYADGNAWAGFRLFAPPAWVPEDWSLSVGANVRLNRNNLTERAWWGASLSIPLYKVPAAPGRAKAPLPPLQPGQQPLPSYEARTPLPNAQASPPSTTGGGNSGPAGAEPAPSAARPQASDDQLSTLADALEAKGLEDISVGRMPDGSVAVRANNGSYTWNAADALGAALGAIARTLGAGRSGYRLILTQRQLPLVGVTGQADCLREWIETPANTCTAGQLSTPGTMPLEPLHEGAVWVVRAQKPAWQTVRVSVSPVLRSHEGTEFGAFDYAFGVNVNALLPLWPGASVDAGVDVPISASEDFEEGAVFGNRRIRSGLDRAVFTQSVRVPLERWMADRDFRRWGAGALTAQVTAGRIGTFYDGVLGALRWEPGEGRHRFGAEGGVFRNNTYENGSGPLGTLRRATPLLASYRYSFLPTRTDLELVAGQFMNNDRGFQVGLRQWFSDTTVNVFYKRTVFPGQPTREHLGIGISLPIGPRRDWRPLPHLQVGGTPRFAHEKETIVRGPGFNPIVTGRGVRPPTPGPDATFNSDRSGLAWFEDNVRRIRDAAR